MEEKLIENIIKIDSAKIKQRTDANFSQLISELKASRIPLVLWGCGDVGERIFSRLEKEGVLISSVFVDEYWFKQGESFHGIPVNRLEEVCDKYEAFNVIIGHKQYDKSGELKKHNQISNVYTINAGFLYGLKHEEIDFNYVKDNEKSFEYTFNALTDDVSKMNYIDYINVKIDKEHKFISENIRMDTYFYEDFISFTKSESYVDCGAYNGDTAIKFMRRVKETGGKVSQIYAIEPDKYSFSELLKLSYQFPETLLCINKGAWNEKGFLSFSAMGDESSMITGEGKEIVSVDTIDNILDGGPASFIKMDIQGAELKALKGAEQTIKKYKPKLAICAYHKAADLITIPQYIKSIAPEYQLYFRLHSYSAVEAVLYAVVN